MASFRIGKMDQIAFIMHVTETKFEAICRKQFPTTSIKSEKNIE